FGGVPNQPPGLPIMYSYAMFVHDQADSFKLLPLLFLFYLLLSTSLLAREIFPNIRMAMVAAVLLVFPPTFIYIVTTPYNSDLPFYSFFVASVFFLMKSKNDGNMLWSILAGCNVSAMILTRDIGLVFFLPILAFLLLGRKRTGKIWMMPLFVLLMVPFSFVLTPQLSEIYTEHSLSLILLAIAILVVLWFLSRDLPIFDYNTSIWTFSVMLIPAALFIFLSVSIWGTPVMRTQIGFLTPQSSVDYSWAAEIATRELGNKAFPIVPLSWQQMALNIVYLYASPALGGLFFVPKIIGTFQGVKQRGTARLPLMLFLVFVVNWLVIFGGFSYDDYSTFRHLFDVVASLSILTVIGISTLVLKQQGTRK
ncbi:MAG: glycosyltransferase family 39 protein, partial [Acidobacteriota bacterium]